ncbi:MAG: calycin-like domain-containing protein [Bacteroidales bacterium]|nr:calycin-like domain-containing protein [Bacteroidales bacterium]
MKKILLTLVVTLFSMNSLFAQDIAKKADGIYNGKLWISLMSPIDDETEATDGQEIKVFANNDNSVTFALYNFSFMGSVLGDIVLPNIPVTEKDGKILFGEKAPVAFNFAEAGIEATAQLNSTTSFIEGDRIYADIDVVWTNGDNLPIYVRFDGNKTASTGIANIAAGKNSGEECIYNLSGVRISTAKGLCIKNGKKVFVK